MGKRLKFLTGEQKTFLLEAEKISGFKQKELAILCGVVGRSYRDWKREKLNMSISAARLICERFGLELPESEEILAQRAISYKSQQARVGGIECYKQHGNFATAEGRRKGGTKTLAILRESGVIPKANVFTFPQGKNVQLAEYVGILLGDGGITDSGIQITLNSEADKDYLEYVIKLIKGLFNFEAPFFKRKDCKANVIYCSGVNLVRYLVNLGLKVGNKVRQQVEVPKWIEENLEFSNACLRGLMDTDGGVFVHRYKVNGKVYKYLKISFSNRSIPILLFVQRTLRKLGFTAIAVLDKANKQVRLYNHNEVLRYLRVVGTSNPRLLKHLEDTPIGQGRVC